MWIVYKTHFCHYLVADQADLAPHVLVHLEGHFGKVLSLHPCFPYRASQVLIWRKSQDGPDLASPAALPQETVDGLDLVPALEEGQEGWWTGGDLNVLKAAPGK